MPPEAISLLEGSCLKAAAVQLEPDMLHTLDSLYAFYHHQWWQSHVPCFQGPPGSPQWVGLTSGGCWHDCIVFLLQCYICCTQLSSSAFLCILLNEFLIIIISMTAGSMFENTIMVNCLAAQRSVIKGWNDVKKFPIKVDMCQFAHTTCAETLTELRNYV